MTRVYICLTTCRRQGSTYHAVLYLFSKADKPDEAEKESAEKLLEAAKAEAAIFPLLKANLDF